MIEMSQGNILSAHTEAIVNTVNTKGVMGKGIALQFKKAFPEMFKTYEKACVAGEVEIGKMHVYVRSAKDEPHYIINFPTKNDWKQPSKIEYIKAGLKSLIQVLRENRINSIAIPPLGCGHGGLNWTEVLPLIQSAFAQIPHVKVILYQPAGAPQSSHMLNATKRPSMTATRVVVLKLFKQYCVLGYELTLLEIQKLLYFLQESGEPLKLRFEKHHYGPYADNVRHVLSLFEGHFTEGFGDGSNKPTTAIRILPGALEEAEVFLKENASLENENYAERLERVKNLINGFESPYGMELLATIHWLIKHESIPVNDYNEIIKKVQTWSHRKKNLMKPEHIRIAIQRLKQEKWI